MSIDDRMLGVIQALYDAALDESLWPAALQQLTAFTGSQSATFWSLESSDEPRLPILTVFNFDLSFMKEYLDGMVPQDPTVQYLVHHPDQPVVHDGIVISERQKDRHPYYDWHGRHSDTRFRIVGQARLSGGVQAGVALHRVRKAGRYESDDVERFSYIYGHLQRALEIGFRFGSLAAMQQCTQDLLDRNPAAILLLDTRKRIIYANRAAEALGSANDGIGLALEIHLWRKQENDRLHALIAGVLSAAAGSVGGVMRASRVSGKRPYAVVVAPVPKNCLDLTGRRPAVCILIADPDAKRLLPAGLLRDVFGLTSAESRLAALLAIGDDLRSAAEKLRITYGTARVRLADIFQKTETRRQAELVKLLWAATAGVVAGR